MMRIVDERTARRGPLEGESKLLGWIVSGRVGNAALVALFWAALTVPGFGAHAEGDLVEATPRPIGAARTLGIEARGLGDAIGLPVEGMVEAKPAPVAAVTSAVAEGAAPLVREARTLPVEDITPAWAQPKMAEVATRSVSGRWGRGSRGTVPPGGYVGGSEQGRRLYVCRAAYQSGTHPGKLVGSNCNIGWGGREIVLPNYEILIDSGSFRWVRGGSVPSNAVVGGTEPGRTLYVCRASYNGGTHPGKWIAGRCNIGWGGREIGLPGEILTSGVTTMSRPPTPLPTPTPLPSPAPPAPTTPPATGAPTTGAPNDQTGSTTDEYRAQLQREIYGRLSIQASELMRLREERRERRRLEAEQARDVQGPSPLGAINLLEGLRVDPGVPLLHQDILQIDHQLYQDANPKTGLFYYLPKRYDLAWNPTDQYAMKVIYGLAQPDAEEGEVYMAARFDSGVDASELNVAKQLLAAYIFRNSGRGAIRFRELRALPLRATSDISLFGGASNQFSIPPDSISVQGVSGLLGVLDVSWATDTRRLLNIESLLRTHAGIHGSVTFHAAADDSFARAIPLELEVASPKTFGRIPFDRHRGWQNGTYYPVRLHRLHMLYLARKGEAGLPPHTPVVFTWELGNVAVPPGGKVRWNDQHLPPGVEDGALLAWVTSSVDQNCTPCNDRVFDTKFIPPMPSSRDVVFTTGDVFEATGAHRIAVYLRSPFLDPQRSNIVTQPAVWLTEDGDETTVARLFVSDRELTGAGADEPLYEYRVEITMLDGSVLGSPEWKPSRSLDFLLGSASVSDLLPPPEGDEPLAP